MRLSALLTVWTLCDCASHGVFRDCPHPHHTVAMSSHCRNDEKNFLPNFWLFLGPKHEVLHTNSSFSFCPFSSSPQISPNIMVRDRCHASPQLSCFHKSHNNTTLLPLPPNAKQIPRGFPTGHITTNQTKSQVSTARTPAIAGAPGYFLKAEWR